MKNKIYTLFTILVSFCLFSCNNILEQKEIDNNPDETYVSFNFGNSRAIVSSATPTEYTYTLVGYFNSKTKTLCEKLPYEDFISEEFKLTQGEWTFDLTAYKNNTAIYVGYKNQTLVKGNNDVIFTLSALAGGTGSLKVKLNYPSEKGVTQVIARLYDDNHTSDFEIDLELGNDSSATFISDAVASGENKFIKFFLFNSQNVCIASWAESVFLINGDSLDLERTLSAVNSFAAMVYLTVQNQPWNNSGSNLKAVKDGKEYTLQAGTDTNAYTASLPLGTYDIYNGIDDTGVDLTVNSAGTATATINYDTRIRYATAGNISQVITSLTSDATIKMSGNLTNDDITKINNAINRSKYKINLDLAGTAGLTQISTFGECNQLTGIVIPDSVTSIGEGAFWKCTSLESIEIPNSVTSIGEDAFYGCTSLKSIEIPNSVTSIGEDVFSGCTSLESIEIPNSVTSIGVCAFSDCTSLESIEIPNSVTSIGAYAFSDCTSLESIKIPNSVTSIGDYAFCGCTSLKSIEIPNSVTSIRTEAFCECTKLHTINFFGTEEQWNAINKDNYWNDECPSDMVINFNCVKATVSNIADVISGLTSDATIIMSGNVTYEDMIAIRNAIKESNCNINLDLSRTTGLIEIFNQCFSGCYKLTGIVIPNSVTSINMSAFDTCKNLKSIEIPNSVTCIEDNAFCNCEKLEHIVIPNTVNSVGMYAFDGCKCLESVEIPDTVTFLGAYAFKECTSLRRIRLPNSITTLDACVFYKCSSLLYIEIPDSVAIIGYQAFFECINLQTVVMPNSVTLIDTNVFNNCISLNVIGYRGSEEQWNAITKGDRWNYQCPSNMVINYNYTGN